MKKLLFIVNPRAGKTKSSAPLFDAVAAFSRAGYLVRVFLTEAGGDARAIAAKWGPLYDVVVCAGGDGTLNETVSGLMTLEQRPPVGYIPHGSTNDFAASLHIPSQPMAAANALAACTQPRLLDLGQHNGRDFADADFSYFCHKLLYEVRARRRRNIASVKEAMHINLFESASFRKLQQSVKVGVVAVYAAA